MFARRPTRSSTKRVRAVTMDASEQSTKCRRPSFRIRSADNRRPADAPPYVLPRNYRQRLGVYVRVSVCDNNGNGSAGSFGKERLDNISRADSKLKSTATDTIPSDFGWSEFRARRTLWCARRFVAHLRCCRAARCWRTPISDISRLIDRTG